MRIKCFMPVWCLFLMKKSILVKSSPNVSVLWLVFGYENHRLDLHQLDHFLGGDLPSLAMTACRSAQASRFLLGERSR
jgi:hypothetical protein